MDINNKYTQMQKSFYEGNASKMAQTDHNEHNSNPDYWDILLGNIDATNIDGTFYYDGKKALDFGCGTGRNVANLLKLRNWERVDGIDISQGNTIEAHKKIAGLGYTNFKFHVNNGVDLSVLPDNEYDFVMSTIVLQHISVYDIRYSILKEIYRVLAQNGLFSFQMGYGNSPDTVGYYENHYDATGTNSDCDVRVENGEDIVKDLTSIGFKNITYIVKPSWSNRVHNNWIYVKGIK